MTTTESLDAIAQLKDAYHTKRAEQAVELAEKILANTTIMRESLLYAIRREAKISVLEPFAKFDQKTDDDGVIPMSCHVEFNVPEHAPIYVLFHRHYQVRGSEEPITWLIGNNAHPTPEIYVWCRGYHTISFYHHDPWDLGEILALAEDHYVEYFHSLEVESGSAPGLNQAIQTQSSDPYYTPAEKAILKALREFLYENRPEE